MTGPSESERIEAPDPFDAVAELAATATSRRRVLKMAAGVSLGSLLAPALSSARAPGARSAWRAVAAAKTTGSCGDQPRQSCPGARNADPDAIACFKNGGQTVSRGGSSEFNGCGPQSGLDLIPDVAATHGDWVPDEPYDLANFFYACKAHDCCYGTCGHPKETCDGNFLLNMEAACQAAWSGDGIFDTVGMSYCLTVAKVYYDAVSSTDTGTQAYVAGQAEVCDCCLSCEKAAELANDPCGAKHMLTCPDPDNPGDYICVNGCADGDNCGACGTTCPPRDNGDGTSSRGCCQNGACTWDTGCLNYCDCWNQGG